jgi:hypothetical protein
MVMTRDNVGQVETTEDELEKCVIDDDETTAYIRIFWRHYLIKSRPTIVDPTSFRCP